VMFVLVNCTMSIIVKHINQSQSQRRTDGRAFPWSFWKEEGCSVQFKLIWKMSVANAVTMAMKSSEESKKDRAADLRSINLRVQQALDNSSVPCALADI
jgi:hypothetical protein